jgi:hypothetical protein
MRLGRENGSLNGESRLERKPGLEWEIGINKMGEREDNDRGPGNQAGEN